MIRKFNPEGVEPPPFYSHGVEVTAPQKLLFVSGQVGVGRDGSLAPDIAGQTRTAIENLAAVLAGGGMGVADIVKATIYLTDGSLIEGFAAAGAPLLPSPPPATTLLVVKALAAPGLLVEIEAVAAK